MERTELSRAQRVPEERGSVAIRSRTGDSPRGKIINLSLEKFAKIEENREIYPLSEISRTARFDPSVALRFREQDDGERKMNYRGESGSLIGEK